MRTFPTADSPGQISDAHVNYGHDLEHTEQHQLELREPGASRAAALLRSCGHGRGGVADDGGDVKRRGSKSWSGGGAAGYTRREGGWMVSVERRRVKG